MIDQQQWLRNKDSRDTNAWKNGSDSDFSIHSCAESIGRQTAFSFAKML